MAFLLVIDNITTNERYLKRGYLFCLNQLFVNIFSQVPNVALLSRRLRPCSTNRTQAIKVD